MNSAQVDGTTAVPSEDNFAASSAKERQGSQAQEPQQPSLDDEAPSSCVSTHSSRLPPRRHERLSVTEAPREPQRSFASPASSTAVPGSSAASETIRNGGALTRRNGAAVLLATDSAAINGHISAGSSVAAAAPPLPPWGRKSSSSRTFSEKPPAEKSRDAADGAAPAWKTPARQQPPPPPETVVASPSPAAASLASLESAVIKADAMVRSWQQCIDTNMENLSSSLASSVFRSGHSAAPGAAPPPAPPSTSASPAHLRDAAEEASQTSSRLKRTSQAPSRSGAGEVHSKASKDSAEDGMNPACHQSAAASSVGVPATAEAVVTTRQPPSVRSRTSSAVVGVVRRGNALVRPEVGEEHGATGSSASSVYQRLPRADPFDKESGSSSHCDSGALPPPPAFSSFASVPSVAAADAAATPKRARGSANHRSFSGSCGGALPPQRRDHQGSVTSRTTAGFEPFHLHTVHRSAVRRSMSPCCAPPDPLSSMPAQERQRLLNLPHQLSTAPGTSRLDMNFEQDVKELYRQMHLVDPHLLSRPGRRQFYIPEQADLFGMYPEPPMTTDEDGNEIVKYLAPIPIRAQSFVPSQTRKSSQSPPMAPASGVQHGKAAGADATDGSNSGRAVVRPGRGLSSFVVGYGEETTAKGRGGLTQPRGRIVSDITAPYRRNMAANTGRTGHIQRESLMANCLPPPCGSETPLPASARSLSSGMMAADESQTSTPFTIMRPTPSSELSNNIPVSDSEYGYAQVTTARMMPTAAPLQDQQQPCVNAVAAFVEDEEYSYSVQSATVMVSSKPTLTVSAAVVAHSSLGGGAGSSSSSHSEGISLQVKPTVAPPPTCVDANTTMVLDAGPKLTATSRPTSTDGAPAAVAERRSRPVRSGEGAVNAAEKASASSLAAASVSLLTEAVTGASSCNNSSAVASAVAAGGPSEPKKAPKDSRRSTGIVKSLLLPQQAEQLQPGESEAVAAAASQSTAPTPKTAPSSVMDKSTHSLAFSVTASSTVVDPSTEPPIPTARRHADPVPVSLSPLSESSSLSQRKWRERIQPTKETQVSPAASAAATAAAAASPSTSLAGTPPALPPPPQAKPAVAVSSEPDKPSAVHEGHVSALERYRRKEAAMSKNGDMRRVYRRSRCSESSATVEAVTEVPAATAAQSDTVACSPPGLKPASTLSMTASSSSPNVVGGAAAGHRSRCRETPLVLDRGTQTEFVFVLDDLQGRQLQQLQQKQLLKNMQLMQLQLQRQPLLIINAGSYSPSTFTTASTPRMSLSPQPQTSGSTSPSMKPRQCSAGLSPTRQRRGHLVNDSRAVRDALWWPK
ncbi:conserved hypothetical protein [Leishmania major strain Friedlin]|uniref:Uncharacterized protein n=1 Tax=Leishmania major TaxID=5664 RepID=Q9U113_LEIMA|nr:conserved hypothetical protein [Leishmania major strain Friedlin]CAC22627.1 conserved hypothetical protein [Leishmania major strain Friedlin]CAG9567777.1 hypothetical_protein_-_conserved [Leishmania major strain Friedlin]|eukprot:XP_888593.1 conserved hypothetical protein [Leishmania major strain Friedlin]